MQVTDTGTGISKDVASRVYDPFFTTKGPHKGRGLGLSLIYGIIQAHQGEISFTCPTEGGTCFSVILPIKTGLSTGARPEKDITSRKRILVVDDEESLRDLILEILEQGF